VRTADNLTTFMYRLSWKLWASASCNSQCLSRPVMGIALPCRLRLKCDGTRAETRFRLSAKRASPFKSAGASVQSTTGSRGVRISGSSAGYTKFRGSVKSTGYPLHSQVSPSLPLPCVTVCHHISTGLFPQCKIHKHKHRIDWLQRVISGFRCVVNEIFVLLGCCAA
jgi:hypothetical protein